MDLKDFVATTLKDLVEGIVEAQKQVEVHGAHINPGNLMRNVSDVGENSIWDNRDNNYARVVSFDVALTIEEGTSTNGKVGVAIGVFKLGAGGSSDNRQLAVNKVQFSVPILFPASKLPVEARKSRTT
jgi:hypothetical protein